MSIRQQRVGELIKAEVSRLLRDQMRDPTIGFVTVTGVEVSRDLRHAQVFVSVLGERDQMQATMEGLTRAQPFVRAEVAEVLELRYAPEIVFAYDTAVERGARVFELLAEIEQARQEEKRRDDEAQPGE